MSRFFPVLVFLAQFFQITANAAAQSSSAISYCGYVDLSMFARFDGEEYPGGYYAGAVRYLSPDETPLFEITIVDGRVVDHRGWLVDSDTTEYFGSDMWSPYAIFVMDHCGRIFLTHLHETGLFHHSTFLAGAPVASAGEMLIIDGLIVYLDNASGHYRPPSGIAQQIVHRLKFLGADLSCAEVNWLF